MSQASRVQGDINDTLTVELKGVEPVPAGTTIEGHVWRKDVAPVTLTGSIDGTTATINLSPWLGDTEPGQWFIEYQATYPDTTVITWPSGSPDTLTIRADADT